MDSSTGPSRSRGGVGRALLMTSTAVAVVAAFAAPAWAQSAQQLLNKIDRLDHELDTVKGQLHDVMQQQKKQTAEMASSPGIKLSTDGGIKIESADGNFVGALGGRMLADTAFYQQDKTRLGDGSEFRSLRLDVSGKMFRDWIFKVQADFAGNSTSIADTYLGFTGLKPVELVVGNILPPVGLGSQTSNKYTTFMEPALPISTLQGRRLGVQSAVRGRDWTATAGAFSSTASNTHGSGDSGFNLAARVTYAPILAPRRVVHVGFGVQDFTPQSESYGIGPRPESHVTSANMIHTGTLANVNNAVTLEPELAAVFGPFHTEAEYQRLAVKRGNGSHDLTFHGWYIQAGYFLTGESRPYQISDTPYSADFGRVKPKRSLMDGGPGAWEIAARYSTLDLTDGSVTGGTERNYTIGLNWYATSQIRFMLNYIKVNTSGDATGTAPLLPGQTSHGHDDPSIVQARAQFDF